MRIRGFTLRLTHGDGRGLNWSLSDGSPVEHGAAEIMLKDSHVVGGGDCLLPDVVRSQTYRFVED